MVVAGATSYGRATIFNVNSGTEGFDVATAACITRRLETVRVVISSNA
jgi:hypothetical protein